MTELRTASDDLPSLDKMPEDYPLTLDEACTVFFRGKIKPVSLRAARDRGELPIQRAGRRDWVTAGAIREFMRSGRAKPGSQGAGSSLTNESGLPGMDRARVAMAAAKQIADELKKGSAIRRIGPRQRGLPS